MIITKITSNYKERELIKKYLYEHLNKLEKSKLTRITNRSFNNYLFLLNLSYFSNECKKFKINFEPVVNEPLENYIIKLELLNN